MHFPAGQTVTWLLGTNLFEIVLQGAIPLNKDWVQFWGLRLKYCRNKGPKKGAWNKHFPIVRNNSLSDSEWISYKFYYKWFFGPETSIFFWFLDNNFEWKQVDLVKFLSCVTCIIIVKIQSCVRFEWCVHTCPQLFRVQPL